MGTRTWLGAGLALLLAAPALFGGGPGVNLALKVRGGYQLGDTKAHLAARTFGFGAEAAWKMGHGALALEVGWQLKPGNQYRVEPTDADSIEVKDGMVLIPLMAADSRRCEMDGLYGRLLWRQPIRESLSWTVGLQGGGARFRQEVLGDIQVAKASAPTVVVARDTYQATLSEGNVALSPLAGIVWQLDASSALECNVVFQRARSLNYRHRAGYVTGPNGDTSRDEVVRESRTLPTLELGFTLRF